MNRIMGNAVLFAPDNARCRAIKSTLLQKEFFAKGLHASTVGDLHQMLKENLYYAPFLSGSEPDHLVNAIREAFSHLYRRSVRRLKKRERKVFDLFFLKRRTLVDEKALLATDRENRFREVDLEYIEEIKSAIASLERRDRTELKEIVGSYFDRMNLYTVVRLRILYRMDPEEILPFLIPYSLRLTPALLGKASNLSTLSELSRLLEGILGSTFDTYHEFRRAVGREHLRRLHRAWYGYPFKISILFSLLRLKEIEAENLNVLIEGIRYRLPPEEIGHMLSGEE